MATKFMNGSIKHPTGVPMNTHWHPRIIMESDGHPLVLMESHGQPVMRFHDIHMEVVGIPSNKQIKHVKETNLQQEKIRLNKRVFPSSVYHRLLHSGGNTSICTWKCYIYICVTK